MYDHPKVVALLLARGAQIDQVDQEGPSGFTALYIAVLRGYIACVRLLLQAGADPHHESEGGPTPLASAIHGGHHEVVALLQARIAELAAVA